MFSTITKPIFTRDERDREKTLGNSNCIFRVKLASFSHWKTKAELPFTEMGKAQEYRTLIGIHDSFRKYPPI